MSHAPKKQRRAIYLSPGQKMLLVIVLLVLLALCSTVFINLRALSIQQSQEKISFENPVKGYVMVGERELVAPFYNEGFAVVGQLGRGTEVEMESWEPFITESGDEYYHINWNGEIGYISCSNITDDQSELMQETQLYVRAPVNLMVDSEGLDLGSVAPKGTLLRVMGYDHFKPDGTVNMYHVKMGDELGWIKSEYVVLDYGEAMKVWTGSEGYDIHETVDNYGGGEAVELDYWPHAKGDFSAEGNVIPEDVYALYIPASQSTMDVVEEYMDLAKDTAINAFVITLNDGVDMAYRSDWIAQYGIMDDYNAYNSPEEFGRVVQRLRDAGYYVIGRVTAFRDAPLAQARPEWAITDWNGMPMEMNDSFWPSLFSRDVWKLKVGFAVEAVDSFAFNEIQFDYVRFPDYIINYIEDGTADLKNTLNESMAQAVQRFLTYATDVLHEHGVYVSADVFGEVANNYVSTYGQYWPAVSNVVDIISGMPYPDHFGRYMENNRLFIPYKRPYRMLFNWANNAFDRQQECASPALTRTWIQTWDDYDYDYDALAIKRQIVGLYDAGITGGYMLWHGNGTLSVADDLQGVIELDYLDLYQQASRENMLLSDFIEMPTEDEP